MQYDRPVVMDGGGRPHMTALLRSALWQVQRQVGRTAPSGNAMPAWALEVRSGSPAELLRPWPAPAHIGPWVPRVAAALGVPIATWPLFGAHPLVLILHWPTDDIDAVRAQKLASALAGETGPIGSPAAWAPGALKVATPTPALPMDRATATAVSAGSVAHPRPPHPPPTATAAYSHVAVANPLMSARMAAAPLAVSSGGRVGFG